MIRAALDVLAGRPQGDGLRAAKLHILQHSLGVDQYGLGPRYSNHFVTGPGSIDYDNCLALVDDGLMKRQSGSMLTGGGDVFFVTDAGKKFVAEHSPPPPKLTRGQRRYREWLEGPADFMTFGAWLRGRAI
jgi:hypothetical protein